MILVAAALAALALLAWAVVRIQYARRHESTDDAYASGHLVPVLAHVGGYVARVPVAENEHVREGQLLVSIDDAELRQQVRKAEADLAVAQAAVGGGGEAGQAESEVQQAQRQRSALSARIEAAQANATRAQRDLERMRGLAQKQIISEQQLDAAQAGADAANAELRSVEQQRSAASASVSTAEAGVKQARARLEAAQAALQNARLQLSYAQVVAPVAGMVAKRSAEPGQLLQPGQPLMTIVADTGVYLTANFKETQLSDIRPGQAVEFSVDAYPGCEAKGTVESISAATGSQFALLPADNATGNFTKVVQRVPVRVRVTDGCGEERPLRPGMSVVVHAETG